MSPKVLLIILGVLVVLFFVGTGWGLLSDDQSVGGAAEAIMSMVEGLQTKEPLAPDDVIGAEPLNCRVQLREERFVLAQDESCRFQIGEASHPVRALTLRRRQGEEVDLRVFTDEDNGSDHTETLDEDDERDRLELQFTREGGQFIMTCARGEGFQNQCILDVLPPE